MIYESAKLVPFLRELADFYEQHPDTPLPIDLSYGWLNVYLGFDEAKPVLASIGSFEKRFKGGEFEAIKKFGAYEVIFKTKREAVCVPKRVETRIVPQHIIPAREEEVIPEHEETVVLEWDCTPILETQSA